MPKKAKEENDELTNTKKNATTRKQTTTAKKNTRTSTTKKSTKEVSASKSTSVKATKSAKTSQTSKKVSKNNSKNTKASSVSKKNPKKVKKATTSTKKKTNIKNAITEYYDLPQKYNQTVVKILAQTPKTLFVYWEISDEDIENYKKQYGNNFFETTKPVLIIYNDTFNYSFEVEINDFANSWYLHTNDSKSDYRIELGRRPFIKNENIKSNYIYITSSNKIESPNDHILFNNSQKMVYFRNVKTNKEIKKSIYTLSFIKNMGKIYDIYDLYLELYKNEDNIENLSNPSSHTSSQFK